MGTRDKTWTVLSHPGPHAKGLLGQQESRNRQTYISAQVCPPCPFPLPSLQGKICPGTAALGTAKLSTVTLPRG